MIVNFYPLERMRQQEDVTPEMIRQTIDIGGPTMAHNARKAWVSTVLVTDPGEYPDLITELRAHRGRVSLSRRLELAKQASTRITHYMQVVDECIQPLSLSDVEQAYEIVSTP